MDIRTQPLHFTVVFNPNNYDYLKVTELLNRLNLTLKNYKLCNDTERCMEIDFHVYMPEADCRKLIADAFMKYKKGK